MENDATAANMYRVLKIQLELTNTIIVTVQELLDVALLLAGRGKHEIEACKTCFKATRHSSKGICARGCKRLWTHVKRPWQLSRPSKDIRSRL
jgi:hypothetical protein